MVNDALGQLFSSAALTVNANTALSSNGNDVTIGRTGLHSKSQVVAYVGAANADRDLAFSIYRSLDDTNFRLVGTITFPAGYKGKQVLNLGESLPWQEWTDANIQLRCYVAAANHANASNWGAVSVYVGAGEETVFGRKANASETLVDS